MERGSVDAETPGTQFFVAFEKHTEERLMQSATQTASASKKKRWAGRIICALVILFLLFDSGLKVMKLAPAVEATARLGYPTKLVFAIGIAELICVVLFVIPRASILGAILLTGYLGGATATQVRLPDPWFFFLLLSACSFGEGLSCAKSGSVHSFLSEVPQPAGLLSRLIHQTST